VGTTKTGGEGPAHLTPRQQKWFATVKANFETQTGKPIEEWVAIARTCPHETPKARRDWLKAEHGIGTNHAAYILSEAFPDGAASWDDPEALKAGLWKDPASLTILQALEEMAAGLPGLVVGHRKSFSAFSKDVQFAAARPLKGGKALLGLKLEPSVSGRLQPSVRRESWSERLTSVVELSSPADVDADLKSLFEQAYSRG
jgi:hypothetical protein